MAVNYTMTLPATAAGYEGYSRVTTLIGRTYHLLFDREIPVALVSGSAAAESLLVEPAAAVCRVSRIALISAHEPSWSATPGRVKLTFVARAETLDGTSIMSDEATFHFLIEPP